MLIERRSGFKWRRRMGRRTDAGRTLAFVFSLKCPGWTCPVCLCVCWEDLEGPAGGGDTGYQGWPLGTSV